MEKGTTYNFPNSLAKLLQIYKPKDSVEALGLYVHCLVLDSGWIPKNNKSDEYIQLEDGRIAKVVYTPEKGQDTAGWEGVYTPNNASDKSLSIRIETTPLSKVIIRNNDNNEKILPLEASVLSEFEQFRVKPFDSIELSSQGKLQLENLCNTLYPEVYYPPQYRGTEQNIPKVGSRDFNPLNTPIPYFDDGGGSLMGPNHPFFQGREPQNRPPFGARYDPIGPLGIDPDPDHTPRIPYRNIDNFPNFPPGGGNMYF